jgi:cell division protease FtsH
MQKAELLNKIAALLGGRAAEDIIFKDSSTGAHNDLARATDIARSMVKEYGMSSSLGAVYLAAERRNRFLDMGPENPGDYSQATAERIDQEISQIIKDQYAVAVEILSGRRSALEKGAALLLEKENIEGHDILALLEQQPPQAPETGSPAS